MDLVGFSLWKFRSIEGVLEGMHPFDVTTTKHVSAKGKVTWLRYDYGTERATIESDDGKTHMECRLSELIQTLKDLRMYVEKPRSERHSSTEVAHNEQ